MYDTEYLINKYGSSGFAIINVKTGELVEIPYYTRIIYSNIYKGRSKFAIVDLYTGEFRYLNLKSIIKYPSISNVNETRNITIN